MSMAHEWGNSRRSSQPARVKPLLLALAGCGLVLGSGAMAATFTVSNSADDGPGSLRQAILSANAIAGADTVQFSLAMPATIVLTSGQMTVTESVTLQAPGNNAVTISGNHNGRLFDVVDAVDDNSFVHLHIVGLTLRDGLVTGENGGCIRAENASSEATVALTDSIVTSCRAIAIQGASGPAGGIGGGVFSDGVGSGPDKYTSAGINTSRSTITGNSATLAGGGLAGYLTVIQTSVVSGNSVTGGSFDFGDGGGSGKYGTGGGVYAALAAVAGSTISGNTVSAVTASGAIGPSIAMGGGVGTGVGVFQASTISGNTVRMTPGITSDYAYLLGGGVASLGAIAMTNSTVSGNSASASTGAAAGALYNLVGGGGVFAPAKYGGSTSVVTASTITGNSLSGSSQPGAYNELFGAGLALEGTLLKSKAAGLDILAARAATARNRIAASGVQLPNLPSAPGDPVLNSSIVANSIGAADVDCIPVGPSCSVTLEGANNLVESAGAGVTLPPGTLTGDPELGPLANNGGIFAGATGGAGSGRVQTHSLYANSPALDAGNNTVFGSPYDQRGPGYPRVKGVEADIGAFEGFAPTEVPALGPVAMGLLSGLLGLFGWRRRPR